jgi:hypothetical protein
MLVSKSSSKSHPALAPKKTRSVFFSPHNFSISLRGLDYILVYILILRLLLKTVKNLLELVELYTDQEMYEIIFGDK